LKGTEVLLATTFDYNTRSQGLLKTLGFKRCGKYTDQWR
jgi:RimJ/RimL family protein N-acetyltransferase